MVAHDPGLIFYNWFYEAEVFLIGSSCLDFDSIGRWILPSGHAEAVLQVE